MTTATGTRNENVPPAAAGETEAFAAFAAAVAQDLEMLANLHDREPTAEVVTAVSCAPLEEQFGLALKSDAALAAMAAMTLAADSLPSPVTQQAIAGLAADFADVYFRHTYRASPSESVWLTADGLERQGPMFAVRAFYQRHNLKVVDPSNRPDDHLVLELRFLAHLFAKAATPADLEPAALFLDIHLLRWIRRHAARLVEAGAPDWFAALSLLTAAYVDEVRDHLVALTGKDRPHLPAMKPQDPTRGDDAERPYVPGAAPSW